MLFVTGKYAALRNRSVIRTISVTKSASEKKCRK
jgi:hypothetical protein